MTTFNVIMPVAGMLSLPFLPLLNELVRRSDVSALPIGDGPFVDYPRRAEQWLDALRANARGEPLAQGDAAPWQALGLRVEHVDALCLARGDRRDGVLYADRMISLGAGAHAAYAFAEERIEMRAGATLGGFAYAPNVDIDNTLVHGAVIGQTVRMHGCGGFANLHGTPIVFGRVARALGRDGTLAPHRALSLANRLAGVPHRVLDGRYLVHRDVRMPSHTILHGTLIVEGRLTLGEGCVLIGSVKAHSVVLECDALLNGAVFARDDVLLDDASCIDGVVSAGGLLRLTGARIGAADHPVSACARDVSVVGHACVHGDLVAWRSGWYHAS
ncbi:MULTISPECIES: polymer-forming cytoskeletal protein [Burkholderia]|uniref:N-acetylglucosamine-1-phosphate uridyltransferase n=1 Tax=Burkholderia savannae TaxID=1637837 RepID=A0ABR5T2K0_9BURK|nr:MULTISPECIES: polymer-forming cytoskeletal protein [Burkholderia]AOK49165.1 N-acetylglucosamine-1-phosphate uridyltransferase [Burkholderia sp. MSMB617WGS]KVK73720.1 N-acetylglucosamine-1-phosphate uridyltransferase [Burkholderia sp. MSMB1498]KWZ37450.1 N-acetylglucosamine-1-phosphate uridyltransferase [Burkholderia savannae]